MKPFQFHPDAFSEADTAAQFYEDQKSQLGKRFIEALTDTISRIRRDPQLYPKVKDNIRKCRILHFPYGVIYREQKNFIEIIAVMHFKRKPGYWKDRI
ncbi:type II toxin-antitoxin system RelE/ParE family toxin [candidate division KSB1 bacterium]|nr:type II toxin-antitoxin system RelE/ParE family toxin [candidate division KSB1 bacterium]